MLETLKIPGYSIKKRLGQGGMAQVFLGMQEKPNRLTAIKILHMETLGDDKMAIRFLKEAKTLSQLIHPNIVSIYDVGQVDDLYYIAMEFFHESLKERIKAKGKIDGEEALHILKQLMDALFYAHDNRIIHRDIKPDNIMFRSDGTPVVLDFGIAKVLDSKTRLTGTGMSIGTPFYMSPEQCLGEELDGRSDIYSMGIMLYEMLTGTVPYRAASAMAVIMKHLKSPSPQLPSELNTFQPLMDKMTAKNKKNRLDNRDEFYNILKYMLNAHRQGTIGQETLTQGNDGETVLSMPTINRPPMTDDSTDSTMNSDRNQDTIRDTIQEAAKDFSTKDTMIIDTEEMDARLATLKIKNANRNIKKNEPDKTEVRPQNSENQHKQNGFLKRLFKSKD